MTAQALIATYLSEIARLYGAKVAHETVLFYEHGWYYLKLDRRFNGSVSVTFRTSPYRRKQLESMLATLRGRPSGD